MAVLTGFLAAQLALAGASCPRCITPESVIDPGDRTEVLGVAEDPDGVVAILTSDLPGADCPKKRILRTVDQGMSWSAPLLVDADPGFLTCSDPQDFELASDGAGRYLVPWVARTSPTAPPTLVIKVSADRGVSWPATATVVTALEPGPASKNFQALADVDGRVWLVFRDGATDAEVHTYVTRSDDAGLSWGSPVRVDPSLSMPTKQFHAARDGADGLVVALITDEGGALERARVVRSDDGGATWGPPQAIDDLAGPANMSGVLVQVPAPGQVLVIWGDDRAGARDILSRASTDGGRSFTRPIVRVDEGDPPGASGSGLPDLEPVGDSLHLVAVWNDSRDGRPQIYANRSVDGGLTWGEPAGSAALRVSTFTPDSAPSAPRIAGHVEGWATVAWRDAGRDAMARCGTVNCPAAYIATTCDGGRSWDPDLRVLDERTGVNAIAPVSFLDAAAGLVSYFPSIPVFHYQRADGPTVVHPRGPTTYCLGADPRLDAGALSAACPGGLNLQWYLDGAVVPGATGPSWQPALPAGDHVVEMRGTCPGDPACAPAWIPRDLHVRQPSQPAAIGNALRAVRNLAAVALDWSRAAPVADSHAHVRRSPGKGQTWALVAPDPLDAVAYTDSPPAAEALHLYDIRRADVCEVESVD